MKIRPPVAAILLVVILVPPSCFARTWANATGTESIEADFVDFNGGNVWLQKKNGPKISMPLSRLSTLDQDYVRNEVRLRHDAIGVRTSVEPGDIAYGPPRKIATLANRNIRESSGLAASRSVPARFWTHNDSGDDARLYLIDSKGRDCGSCLLRGVQAYDWEDVASCRIGQKAYLVVADTGNNGLAAAVHMLYVIEEPPIDPRRGVSVEAVPVAQVIHFAYADDHRNCEAVAIDPTTKTFLLATKEQGTACYVYSLPWPEDRPKKAFTARQIAALKLPGATAMDVSPDGLRTVILTYGNAFEYTRRPDETWSKGFARAPREIRLPNRTQGESICYGPDGKTLYLTSERLPTPLWEVPAK